MKIAVIGAGAIGNLVAGYLKVKGEEVFLAGNSDSIKAIKEKGLIITGVRGDFKINIETGPFLTKDYDLVILAVKSQDLEQALKNNLGFLKNCLVLTTQNGVQADNITAKYIPKDKIISSIVMFGATYLEPGKVVHNFEGAWIIGAESIKPALEKAFSVAVSDDIKGMKYLKIFVNANNCIPAILGKSMQEAFVDIEISKISIAIWKEGLNIVTKAGIALVSLPDFPLERLMKLTNLPLDEAAKIFSGIISGLSQAPLYGSILQSIKRARESEIDYLNGEFVKIARENNVSCRLNEKLVNMVHEVENTGSFFSKADLINATKDLLN